jgi:predicted NAD/FAD-dependent oxidoreductase
VAVIGAGISGLTCAQNLTDHDVPVTVFEKSRGVGGRMATRRSEHGAAFDHGAQYFTVRDERFQMIHVPRTRRGFHAERDRGRQGKPRTSFRNYPPHNANWLVAYWKGNATPFSGL